MVVIPRVTLFILEKMEYWRHRGHVIRMTWWLFVFGNLGNFWMQVKADTTIGPEKATNTHRYDLAKYVKMMAKPEVNFEQTTVGAKENGETSKGSITYNHSANDRTHSSEIAFGSTTFALVDANVELPCSVLAKYGSFNFRYKYSPKQIQRLLCRCRKVCIKVTIAPHIKEEVHNNEYNPLSYKNKQRFIGIVSAFSLLLLIGLIGNIATIVGLLNWVKHTSPTFAFIISLSCSDLLLLCICMPLKVTEYFHLGDVFTEFTCRLSYYIRDFTLICSVLTLTVISFERYYAICHPLVVQYRCTWIRARNIIMVTWAASLFLALPTVFMTKYYLPAGMNRKECSQQSDDDLHLQLYFIYFLGILFILPVLVMIFTYGRSCYVLWKSTQISSQLQGKDQMHRKFQSKTKYQKPKPKDADNYNTRRKVIRILVLIVCIFILCWGPPLIVQLLSVMSFIRRNRDDIRLAMEALTYISSALDPYLFMAMSSQFRHAAMRCLRCMGRRRDLGYTSTYKESSMSMHTVTNSGIANSETEHEYHL